MITDNAELLKGIADRLQSMDWSFDEMEQINPVSPVSSYSFDLPVIDSIFTFVYYGKLCRPRRGRLYLNDMSLKIRTMHSETRWASTDYVNSAVIATQFAEMENYGVVLNSNHWQFDFADIGNFQYKFNEVMEDINKILKHTEVL